MSIESKARKAYENKQPPELYLSDVTLFIIGGVANIVFGIFFPPCFLLSIICFYIGFRNKAIGERIREIDLKETRNSKEQA